MKTLITNAKIVNDGKVFDGDVLINDNRIEKIGTFSFHAKETIDAKGQYLLPGVIDDQVHFREPGLTHKGNIFSESRAAVAGGITSFMDMPNTLPPTFTQELLEEKYNIASRNSIANYSFFIGASGTNEAEVMKTNLSQVCGLKIFMGSSTGQLLVDDERVLERFFSKFQGLIATHCEDESIIQNNLVNFRLTYGEDIPMDYHPLIRSAEACYKSSSYAVGLAKKFGTRLHVLHISTAREVPLFSENIELKKKKITSEACLHHLWFTDSDYAQLGSKIKWNPAIKTKNDREALIKALKEGHIDIVASDHAPHTWAEKQKLYFNCPSGGPLVQHSLTSMLELCHRGIFTIEEVVEKMCHNPAILFNIVDRGYIREGFFADLVLVDMDDKWMVGRENIMSACGWSPFEGMTFRSKIKATFVSGRQVYKDGQIVDNSRGQRLQFKQ